VDRPVEPGTETGLAGQSPASTVRSNNTQRKQPAENP